MIAQHLGLSSQQVVTGELKIVLKADDIPLKLMLLLKDAIILLKVPQSTNDPKRGGVFL